MGYKMIINNSVVDADINPSYMRYHAKLDLLLMCTEADAQYIASKNGDVIWHIDGTQDASGRDYQTVQVIEADDDEVRALMDAFDAQREPLPVPMPVLPEDKMSDDSIAIIKQHTLDKMRTSCADAIDDGFDVVLSDGHVHHFALSPSDYLNMIALNTMKHTFVDGVPYRADGEDMKVYSYEDFDAILAGAARCRSQHYLYCQNLCAYVNTLETLAELQGVSYGMNVPEEYQISKGVC